MGEAVTFYHIQPLAKPGSTQERVVGEAEDGRIVVALREAAADSGTCETVFELSNAEKLARACLSGDERALTTPGLARIFAASIIVLSRAAYQAGALEAQPADGGPGDDGHSDD
jgi:hypothetical protein